MNSIVAKNRILPSLGLLIVLLAACAPAAVAPEPSVEQQPAPAVALEPTATVFAPADTVAPADPSADVVAAPTEAVAPLPIATSRGDNLEATDPRTVNLASGGFQFVEFFRFT